MLFIVNRTVSHLKSAGGLSTEAKAAEGGCLVRQRLSHIRYVCQLR